MNTQTNRWRMFAYHYLLLALLPLLVSVTLTSTWHLSAKASAICPAIVDAIPLVPEITEQSSQGINWDFYTTSLSIVVHPGQRIILSSTPNGQEPTRADDLFWIQVSPSGREWSHDYRNAARTQIVPLPAQDITQLFVIGTNTVTVKVTDLIGPQFSSQPFYLVLIDTYSTPTPIATSTSTALPTDTATLIPSATATPVPPTTTVTHTSTPVVQIMVVTATPSDTPQPTATAVPVAATFIPTPLPSVPTSSTGFLTNMARWMLVGFLLSVGGTSLWWWVQSTEPLLTGEIDVYRQQQYLTTYDLAMINKALVTIGKHGDIVLPDLIDAGTVAHIKLRDNDGAMQLVTIIEMLNPYNAEEVLEVNILTDGYELTVGPYHLQYRSNQPAIATPEEESNV